MDVCKKHQVKSIALFGSAAKGTVNTKSDFDLLVEFSSELEVLDYANNYFSLLDALEKILERKVDLVSVKSLKNPVLLEEINKYKVNLYAA
ncbi:nucleotidyltransferase family protein [Psychroflexus salis]|uniref:nucleotidyltransferase family protein n=1 Tax=Psychroflexus salis TaxID=1526574 RepID=UPI0021D0D1E1|nr:nucleotidyltransferase domain-containing protein [Psychroflexus salis]